MRKLPDHRSRSVRAAAENGKPPKGALEVGLYDLFLDKKKVPSAILSAHDIYAHEFKREVIEAFLLCGATPEEIKEILEVALEVTETYSYLFFDASVFENQLDVLDYAYEYGASKYGSELKRFAVDLGKECLKVRMSHGTYAVETGVVQKSVRSTAYLMAQLAHVNPADSGVANAALRWAQVGLKAATEEIKEDSGGVADIQLALETRNETTDEEQSGISIDEILH